MDNFKIHLSNIEEDLAKCRELIKAQNKKIEDLASSPRNLCSCASNDLSNTKTMSMYLFKTAFRYVILFALFLSFFLAIHSIVSLVIGLITTHGFMMYFSSGLVIITGIVTIILSIPAYAEYEDFIEWKRFNYSFTRTNKLS